MVRVRLTSSADCGLVRRCRRAGGGARSARPRRPVGVPVDGRGIDVDARHIDGRRYIIEAKAEVGVSGPQQVNYFLGMLGELLQRMDDQTPAHEAWNRLSGLARLLGGS